MSTFLVGAALGWARRRATRPFTGHSRLTCGKRPFEPHGFFFLFFLCGLVRTTHTQDIEFPHIRLPLTSLI